MPVSTLPPSLLFVGEQCCFADQNDSGMIKLLDSHGLVPGIDDSDYRKERVGAAVDVVQDLALGEQSQYGVTTGFGGSGKK